MSAGPWGETLSDEPYTPQEWVAPGGPAADGGRVTATFNALAARVAELEALCAELRDWGPTTPAMELLDLRERVATACAEEVVRWVDECDEAHLRAAVLAAGRRVVP